MIRDWQDECCKNNIKHKSKRITFLNAQHTAHMNTVHELNVFMSMCVCVCVAVCLWLILVFSLSVCQWRSGCPQWGVYTKWVRKVLAPALHQRLYWLKAWDCLCSQSSLDSWQWAWARGDIAESNQQPTRVKCFDAGGMCLNSRTAHYSALKQSCPNGSTLPWSPFN